MQKSDTMVKVWNRNKFDYSEIYNGKMVEIKAHGFVEMEYEQANRFMGKISPIKKDKHGIPLPSSYKKLEMDPEDKRKAELCLRNETEEKLKKTFVCFKCSKEFSTKTRLLAHVKENHMDDLADETTRDEVEDMEA